MNKERLKMLQREVEESKGNHLRFCTRSNTSPLNSIEEGKKSAVPLTFPNCEMAAYCFWLT
jgi:hypothetical protein